MTARRGRALSIYIYIFFFRFLELRYRGEILRLTDRVASSSIDGINRPVHTGDFSVQIPPAPRNLSAFFEAWRPELPEVRQ